jgi:type IX secretion system PorP/SprF family membrane protein
MKLRNHWIGALLLLTCLTAAGQQDPMYSMYMFNRLAINPAYAGSRAQLSATLLGRRQWMGFQGAPHTESFSLHAPTADQRHGFGLLAVNDRAGYTNNTAVTGSYAYRVPVGLGHLAMGMQLGLNSYWVRQSKVGTWDAGDPSFGAGGDFSKVVMVAGPGIYYNNEKWFAGASIPDIIPHKLYDQYYEPLIAKRSLHYFVMGGCILDFSRVVSFKPSFMLKAVQGAPMSLDLNASFLLNEQIWVGGTWRPNNSFALVTEFYLRPNLRLGYAYDVPTTALRNYSTGSHELMLGMDFGFAKEKIVSPKLF